MTTYNNQVLFMCPMSKIMPIIRPVGEQCNLKCSYCYYNSSNQQYKACTVMSDVILEKFISQFLDLFDGDITFLWHGGEPMLAGMDFYKKVLFIENKYQKPHQNIVNNIQTNGVLLDKKWASFFKENNIHVGLSLDGVKPCHDLFRKNQNGDSSFAQVIQSIEILREFDMEPGILQTVTKSALPYIEDNFYFFVDKLLLKKWGVNVYNDSGNANPLMKSQSLTNEEYYELYKRLFDLWLKRNDSSIEIREINDFVSGILGKYTGTCHTSGICSAFIAVDNTGIITPTCDKYLFNNKSLNNNILDEDLLSILNGDTRIQFYRETNSRPTQCRDCEWYAGCFNGCTFLRDKNNHYLYCSGRKRLFSYIKEVIDNH